MGLLGLDRVTHGPMDNCEDTQPADAADQSTIHAYRARSIPFDCVPKKEDTRLVAVTASVQFSHWQILSSKFAAERLVTIPPHVEQVAAICSVL